MSGYAPDVTVSIPDELQIDDGDDTDEWRRPYRRRPAPSVAPGPPERIPAGETSFACSGSLDSRRYREATKFRTLPEMGWEEARIALNRLHAPILHHYDRRIGSHEYVALAEFALAASGFTGFVGKRGEHAVKLRDGLIHAVGLLHRYLNGRLDAGRRPQITQPLASFGADMRYDASVHLLSDTVARVLGTLLPAAGRMVRLHQASPDEAMAALDSLRETLTTWQQRRPEAEAIAERLIGDDLPSASEYAEAVHIADMLVWAGETLVAAYTGYMIAMPIYRLYPATPEREAIALWWPWGRAALLGAGPPAAPAKSRKFVLDPSVITATNPADVVREVMQKTGINRTTAQLLTAEMRSQMRTQRQYKARGLLLEGLSKTETARRVGLSPSRISAMFKDKEFDRERRRAIRNRKLLALIKDDDSLRGDATLVSAGKGQKSGDRPGLDLVRGELEIELEIDDGDDE